MTAKQKRFVDEYLVDLNATQAAIRAGYSAKTAERASDWINEAGQERPSSKFNPELREYIDAQLERMHSERTADAQEVIEYLSDVMRGKSRSHVLCLCGEGCQEVIEKPPDERERLKAAELLGKRYALFTDKTQLSADDMHFEITVDYSNAPGENDG